MTIESRFWPKVDKSRGPSACWLWIGSHNDKGYGEFTIDNRRVRAHRVAYELLIGPIPEGLTLDHLCRVRDCVNPAHLEPVTNRENTLRGEGLAARNARKDRCDRGHPYDEVNTAHLPSGYRKCRACARIQGAVARRARGIPEGLPRGRVPAMARQRRESQP